MRAPLRVLSEKLGNPVSPASAGSSQSPFLFTSTSLPAPSFRHFSSLGARYPCTPSYLLLNRPSTAAAITAAATGKRSTSTSAAFTDRVPREVEEYWTSVLQSVDKPTAKRLIPFIDTSLPLGLIDLSAPKSKTTSSTTTSRAASPPAFKFFRETKLLHPTKVILCRVGEFYEAVGIDAILLVQHAGLNPMGKEGNPPRAGCPRVNLRRTVYDLVQGAGLSVVLCEEAPEGYQYGARKAKKERFVAEVITPAAPHFLHGLIDEDTDVIVDSTPPLLGIAPRVGGFAVIEVDAELQTVRVTEGLTEDAVYSRLHEGGLAPPLYLHTPPAASGTDRRLTEAIPEGEWERRVSTVFRNQVGTIERYNDSDPVQGMVERVKRQLSLPAEVEFRVLPAASPKTRPRPLYYSTATNLGLHKVRGVPSVLDYALPAGASLTARRWLKNLLLLPPTPAVGLAIHAACAALQSAQGPIPAFPVMAPANIVLKLRSKEANDTFFRELGDLCRAVAGACGDPLLEKFSDSVLVAAAAETGVNLDRKALKKACMKVLESIHDVVDHDTEIGTGRNGVGGFEEALEEWTGGGGSGGSGSDEEESSSSSRLSLEYAESVGTGSVKRALPPKALDNVRSVLGRMFASNEDFRGKIRPEKLSTALQTVENAKIRVFQETCNAVVVALDNTPTSAASSSSRDASLKAPSLQYDVANNAAWLRLPRSASSKSLIHPRDRNGKSETAFYSTPELEAVLDDYRRACADARDAVREELRKLAANLQPSAVHLVAAASFATVASALDAHVREAARRGWALPTLSYGADAAAAAPAAASPANQFTLEGMWPYWLGGAGGLDPGTIRNSFQMDGMFLLTGPNMAGKSTILRTTCAVALLGACGLAVPAAPTTTIPYFDAFMLRNFSADSPLEGRSSFAVEMDEMRFVLEDATSRSLVLVDELGKGTEARAGAALAGAMLESLDQTRCKGIFATHLHALLEMELELPGTKRMMMEIEDTGVLENDAGEELQVERRKRKPTWRMVPGQSVESLALEVATACKLPSEVVERAAELYKDIMNSSTSSSQSVVEVVQESRSGDNEEAAVAENEEAGVAEVQKKTSVQRQKKSLGLPTASEPLRDAAALLESTAASVLHALSISTDEVSSAKPLDQNADNSADTLPPVQAGFVPAGQVPPARTVGASCVYIARRSDGWFYVGSTDSLQDRIKTHRQRGGGTRIGDPDAEFAYVVVNVGGDEGGASGAGASAAKSVEAQVIKAMEAEKFPLLSDIDKRKRYAPVSRVDRYLKERGARHS